MGNARFPKDFLWGTATASYQVEGAVKEDGRTPSIWDTFAHTPGMITDRSNGDVACDQYHRYREDVELMKQLGGGAYRFSISWPRIFPTYTGNAETANAKGVDYYNRLIDTLLEAGIEPVPTLYHWDLPQYIDDGGGWADRDCSFRFADYAAYCYERFGDRVKRFITLNEPWCSSILGYLFGMHAPGKKHPQKAYNAIHNLLFGHGLSVLAYRQVRGDGQIGIALNIATPRPASDREEDRLAADRSADRETRMFLDPLFGRGYPKRHLDTIPELKIPAQEPDFGIIATPIDFIGLNYYFEHEMEYNERSPEDYSQKETDLPKTAMGWDIVPDGLYRQLKWVSENYPEIDLYITENGCAFDDVLTPDGTACHDPQRIEYLRSHIDACARAIDEGVRLKGYFLWSFIDNFEWTYGYTKRFGIVYCNYPDGRRIPKDSFYFYRDIIAESVG